MTEPVVAPETHKPGAVIFAAVLNFIGSGVIALLMLVCLGVVIFGGTANFAQKLSGQVPNLPSYGAAGVLVALTILLIFLGLLMAFSLYTAFGLLKGKKLAWYFQIVISVTGLLQFPIGTVLNAVILFFFFKHDIRDYFKV